MTALCPTAPKCGFIKGNEKISQLLDRVKPEIVALRETIVVVSEPPTARRFRLSVCLNPSAPPAGVLLDSAPYSQNRRRKRLRSGHSGTAGRPPRSGSRSAAF